MSTWTLRSAALTTPALVTSTCKRRCRAPFDAANGEVRLPARQPRARRAVTLVLVALASSRLASGHTPHSAVVPAGRAGALRPSLRLAPRRCRSALASALPPPTASAPRKRPQARTASAHARRLPQRRRHRGARRSAALRPVAPSPAACCCRLTR
eukprot:362120-Chlamydomonas_euryale.AAC.14